MFGLAKLLDLGHVGADIDDVVVWRAGMRSAHFSIRSAIVTK